MITARADAPRRGKTGRLAWPAGDVPVRDPARLLRVGTHLEQTARGMEQRAGGAGSVHRHHRRAGISGAGADGRPPEPERAWLRHPDETARAYAAFRHYRDLGAARSQTKVGQKCALTRNIIGRWAKVHAWVLRARLWDEHQDRIQAAVSTDAIQTMRLEHADWGRTASVAAVETITAWMQGWRDRGRVGEPPFTAFEGRPAPPGIGTHLEQTARGLEPEGLGDLGGGGVGEALQEWASRLEAILTEPRADEPIP